MIFYILKFFYGAGFGCWSEDATAACPDRKIYFVHTNNGENDLLESKKTIGDISSDLGYSSVQHFSSAFKKKFGLSPNKLKR